MLTSVQKSAPRRYQSHLGSFFKAFQVKFVKLSLLQKSESYLFEEDFARRSFPVRALLGDLELDPERQAGRQLDLFQHVVQLG
jgi:hypothetical protein